MGIAAVIAGAFACGGGQTPAGGGAVSVASISPSSAMRDGPAFTLTVHGANLPLGSQLTWFGSPLQTLRVSASELHVSVPAAALSVPGTYAIRVTAPGGVAVDAGTFLVMPGAPLVTSLQPNVVQARPTSLSSNFTISGSNFAPGLTISWNGQPVSGYADPSPGVPPTRVFLFPDLSLLQKAGTATIAVTNPDPGGGTSSPLTLTITELLPVLESVEPVSAFAAGGAFSLTVRGTNFAPGAAVLWNGSSRPLISASSSELRVQIPAADVSVPGTAKIAVRNPDPGGGTSSAFDIPITNPAPALAAFAPLSVAAGARGFTLTVSGDGFVPATSVLWNGGPLSTTVASRTVLHADVSPADVASVGSAVISVATPGPGGGAAVSSSTLSILPPAAEELLGPSVAFQVNPAHSGAARFGVPLQFPSAPAWSVALGSELSYPLIADGRVFVLSAGSSSGTGTQLQAFDEATGNALWGPIDVPGNDRWAGHAYERGLVYVVNADGVARAFDAATGALAWSLAPHTASFTLSSPVALGGVLYFAGLAADDRAGELLWTNVSWWGADGSPAVTFDGLFVSAPCEAGKFDLLTGSPIWSRSGGCSGFGAKAAAYSSDHVYARQLNLFSPHGAVLDQATGAVRGNFQAPSTIPALGRGAAFFVENATLTSRSLTADVTNWSFTGDGYLVSAPLIVDDAVFVGSSTGIVYGLDVASGAILWTADAGSPLSAPDETLPTNHPLTGFGAGEGFLVVPAGSRLTAWRLIGP